MHWGGVGWGANKWFAMAWFKILGFTAWGYTCRSPAGNSRDRETKQLEVAASQELVTAGEPQWGENCGRAIPGIWAPTWGSQTLCLTTNRQLWLQNDHINRLLTMYIWSDGTIPHFKPLPAHHPLYTWIEENRSPGNKSGDAKGEPVAPPDCSSPRTISTRVQRSPPTEARPLTTCPTCAFLTLGIGHINLTCR